MSANSNIEWCDHTFNPWTGCTKVSPGCDHCYAEGWSKRAGAKVGKWGPGRPRVRTQSANWKQPIKWDINAEAFLAEHGRRQRVFCASLADVFDSEAPVQWRMDLFKLIADTPNLDWLILTKRIGNVMPMCSGDSLMFDMICERVWLGATVVNQQEADRDIPKLLAVPAAKRFLSMEPLLGPVELGRAIACECCGGDGYTMYGPDEIACSACEGYAIDLNVALGESGIDWVIAGGESGPGARAAHSDWFRSLRDQCAAAGVPFLFKQWGEWLGPMQDGNPGAAVLELNASDSPIRVGKKAAGRLLDGIEHNGFPA